MDLSPKLLTDVQFREQWRGYNPDEVDEFLERVAAGVDELQTRLTEAMERASNAERRLLERSDEDEIRRTLVLAQRTAVASMEEARVEADRLVSETEVRCRQLVADAEAQAARLDADIATRRRLELGDLAEQRAALQLDIDHLQAFLDGERTRLAGLLRGQVDWIESNYALSDIPTVSAVVPSIPHAPAAPVEMRVPEPIAAEPVLDEPVVEEPVAEPEPAPMAPAPATDLSTSAVDELRLAREELADALRRAGVETDDDEDGDDEATDDAVAPEPEPEPEPEPLQLEPQLPRPALFDDRAGDATGAYDVITEPPASEPALAQPAPAAPEADEDPPHWRDEHEDEDDPFLAELRRAVVDTEPLGPREHAHEPSPVEHGGDDDDLSSGGFFRRGRRRG
jgi:cell division initiation protein